MLFPWADSLFGNKAIYFFIVAFIIVGASIAILTKMKNDQDKAKAASGL